ncbi:hypothetical protein PW035_55800, partial [Nonomuraea angiospora]
MVVDYDLIAGALSGPHSGHPHDHPEPVRTIAFKARTAAIREALRHVADVDVYIIHSMPKPEWLVTYAEHGAQVITIDPGRDVVMQRIAAERPTTARAVATRWYNQTGTQGQGRQGRARTPQGAGPPHPPPHSLYTLHPSPRTNRGK